MENIKKCKLCDEPTDTGFNINFKLTPICESCANSIFLQQASWLTKQTMQTKTYSKKEIKNIKK